MGILQGISRPVSANIRNLGMNIIQSLIFAPTN